MNNPLTPVVVLDSNIAQLMEYIASSRARGIEPVMAVQFLAALKLAKADAELASYVRNEPRKYYVDELVCDEWFEWHIRKIEIERNMEDGRTKLYQALKQ